MTIHSDWARVLHDECTEAFLKEVPGRVPFGVGIVDGHLQLMRMHGHIGGWDKFVEYLFVRPLRKLLDAGCPVVVMCFDSYDHVPVYKSMTQSTRVSRHEVKVFHPHQDLPPTVPEDAMLFLMNRTFKLKVIDLVCRRLPELIRLDGDQVLIVDYKRVVSYRSGSAVPQAVEGFSCMGESDVKFCRYVAQYGNALVHAIDGDYIAIALLYYARAGITDGNRMYIYRHLATLEKGGTNPSRAQKRQRGDGPSAQVKKVSEKCWVDMQLLYAVIARAVGTSLPGVVIDATSMAPVTDAQCVSAAVLLMLMAGTDFSRGIPHVGPKRMWDALPHVAFALLQTQMAATAEGEALAASRTVVARLYRVVFDKHLKDTSGAALPGVLEALQHSKLAERTKRLLPDIHRIETTARNLRWLVAYWSTVNGLVDTPLDGQNGYVRNSAGEVVFSDDASSNK